MRTEGYERHLGDLTPAEKAVQGKIGQPLKGNLVACAVVARQLKLEQIVGGDAPEPMRRI